MAQSGALLRPTLSGVAMVQPSSSAVGVPQAGFDCPQAGTDEAYKNAAAKPRRRNLLLPARMLPSPIRALRRRRDRDLHRRPLQHFLMEGIELRIGLAPAAVRKAEIGIAEHADEADLRDVEWPRQHVGLFLEMRHSLPG